MIYGTTFCVIEGDTRSIDNGSYVDQPCVTKTAPEGFCLNPSRAKCPIVGSL